MTDLTRQFFDPPFAILAPTPVTAPVVFNSPHSGRIYPEAFVAASRLGSIALRRSEDAFVDLLLAKVRDCGAPLLAARFPRAYLDVNREPYELDPRMFDGRLPPFANTRSMRVAGGLGTIPRIVGDSQEIYSRRLPAREAFDRIEALYKPYHRALRQLLGTSVARFGYGILVDCHSMPSAAVGRDADIKAEIVLGDRYGTSCGAAVADAIEEVFVARGLRVVRNRPYAGGFITEHYGQPALDRHAIQVEVSRALYLDEQRIEPTTGLPAMADAFAAVGEALASLTAADLGAVRLAAE
jgi:N-formylglutamate amidohydrolase